MTRLARILAHLAQGPATVAEIAVALGANARYIRQDMTHLTNKGRVVIAGSAINGVAHRFALPGKLSTPSKAPPATWPLIKPVLEAAGKAGVIVRDIAKATGLTTTQVMTALTDAQRRGDAMACGFHDIGGNKMRTLYRLDDGKRAPGERQTEVPVIPAEKVLPELLRHAAALRERGFSVSPRKGGVWDVGRMVLKTPDMVALATRQASVAELMGVSR